MANENEKKNRPGGEQARRKKEEQARSARRRSRQLIGVALSVLIVVGAISIVQMGVNLIRSLNDTGDLRGEYQERIDTLVWFDVLPFTDPSLAGEDALKQAFIWKLISEGAENFARNEQGMLLIPSLEIDLYAASLFGPSFRFSEHATFYEPSQMMEYTYDADTESYAIMITSPNIQFLPSVVDVIREKGGVRRVVVGYVLSQSGQGIVQTPDYDNPERYMDFLFRRDGSEYYLYALEPNTGLGLPAGSTPAPAQPDPDDENALPLDLDDDDLPESDPWMPPGTPDSIPSGSESSGGESGADEPEPGSGSEDGSSAGSSSGA